MNELDFPIDECVITTESQSTEEPNSRAKGKEVMGLSSTLPEPPPPYQESDEIQRPRRNRERCVLV